MKKKTIKSEVITTVAISIVLGILVINLLKLEPPIIEPIVTTEVHIESQESSLSPIIPVDVQAVEIQNVEPEANIFYDIPISDEEQWNMAMIAGNFRIDYKLLLAIIKTESEFNPNQIGDNGRSFGLMQIQPRWWTSYFNDYGCSDWLSVSDNVTVGCAILRYLYDSYGDTVLVLNAYNTGNPNNYNGYSDRVLSNLYEVQKLKR